MVKGAIFDLDGTLIDSMSIWDTIGEDYLRSLGKEPAENLNEVFKSFSLSEAAKYYQTHYGVTLSVDEIISGASSMIEDFYVNTVPLKHGVRGFLIKLYCLGVKMCVATATDARLADLTLSRLGVRKYFSEIFTCESVGKGKESPKIYREAASHLKTKKSQTIVFEDALHALKTAKEDGFLTAAVYDSHEIRQDALKEMSDFYILDYEKSDDFWMRITG